MRLDLRKLRFRQPKLVATHLCLLFGSRESRHYARANTFMGPDPRADPSFRSRQAILLDRLPSRAAATWVCIAMSVRRTTAALRGLASPQFRLAMSRPI